MAHRGTVLFYLFFTSLPRSKQTIKESLNSHLPLSYFSNIFILSLWYLLLSSKWTPSSSEPQSSVLLLLAQPTPNPVNNSLVGFPSHTKHTHHTQIALTLTTPLLILLPNFPAAAYSISCPLLPPAEKPPKSMRRKRSKNPRFRYLLVCYSITELCLCYFCVS